MIFLVSRQSQVELRTQIDTLTEGIVKEVSRHYLIYWGGVAELVRSKPIGLIPLL